MVRCHKVIVGLRSLSRLSLSIERNLKSEVIDMQGITEVSENITKC